MAIATISVLLASAQSSAYPAPEANLPIVAEPEPAGTAGRPKVIGRYVDVEGAPQSLNELQNRGCLGFQHAFHQQLALRILHSSGDGGGMHVHADILLLTHKGAPFR